MAIDRDSLEALKNMIEEVDDLISTTDPLPENRTSRCRELLRAALPPRAKVKNAAAVALGKLGGSKGGKIRAQRLTPEKRKEITQRAAEARWAKAHNAVDS